MGVWRLPFDNPLKPYEEGQQFGNTSYPRGRGYFHDGYDFGSAKYSGDFKAVNDGKVIYASYYGYGLGTVIVLQIADYQVMYQEFGNTIYVKVGDQVKAGQALGRLTTTHLHLGMTKQDWRTALGSWDLNNGTWINPIPILTSGSSTDNQPQKKEEEATMVCLYLRPRKGESDYYYFNGVETIQLTHVDQVKVLQQIYKANNGKEMPILNWTKIGEPWYQRLEQVAPIRK